MITVFSKHGCTQCVTLKKVLKDSGFGFKEVIVKDLYELYKLTGEEFESFPILFDNNSYFDFETSVAKYAEPLIHNKEKFTMYPIEDIEIYEMYKKSRASYWQPEEITFSKDMQDWESLTSNEQYFILHVLAFFAGSDGIGNKNLNINFEKEVSLPEAKAFYTTQSAIESIHSETYSIMIDKFANESEKSKLQHAIETMPAIKSKADWAFKYMNNDMSFAQRLLAFACVEGIYFSGSFCAIYWLKKRNLLPGLAFSNELISRDEGLHTEFAVLLYTKLKFKLDENDVHNTIKDAVLNEKFFINESLPCRLIGMNSDLMSQYIEFVADRLCASLGYSKIYFSHNPFDFMENISLEGKSNFFEKRVAEYSKAVHTDDESIFTIDEEF